MPRWIGLKRFMTKWFKIQFSDVEKWDEYTAKLLSSGKIGRLTGIRFLEQKK